VASDYFHCGVKVVDFLVVAVLFENLAIISLLISGKDR
jgi:hypothetical protein